MLTGHIFSSNTVLKLILIASFTCAAIAQANCVGSNNTLPVLLSKATLADEVAHGRLYTENYGDTQLLYASLQGTPYEIGYAYGQLLKTQLNELIPQLPDYAQQYILKNTTLIKKIPILYRKLAAKLGVKVYEIYLEINYYVTTLYWPKRYSEQLNGIADASGVSLNTLREINLLPQIIPLHNSVVSATGVATTSKSTVQLSAFDFDAQAPFSQYPLITIYHSSESNSVPYATFGWVGIIGVWTTGYNAKKVAIAVKTSGDDYDLNEILGEPFVFAARDSLQFSSSIGTMADELLFEHRSLPITFASATELDFRFGWWRKTNFYVLNWFTMGHDEEHPSIRDLAWRNYGNGECYLEVLENYKNGKINAETFYSVLAPLTQTGNSQVVVIDIGQNTAYVQYSAAKSYNPAYNAEILKINLIDLFNL